MVPFFAFHWDIQFNYRSDTNDKINMESSNFFATILNSLLGEKQTAKSVMLNECHIISY